MNIFHKILDSQDQLVGYLFGTCHYDIDKITYLPIEVKEALESSQVICTELGQLTNVDIFESERQKYLQSWSTEFGKKNEQYLEELTLNQKKFIKNIMNINIKNLSQVPPMGLLEELTQRLIETPMTNEGNCLDLKIQEYAKVHRKAVIGLETIVQQIVFTWETTLPLEKQHEIFKIVLEDLIKNISNIEEMQKSEVNRIISSYLNNLIPDTFGNMPPQIKKAKLNSCDVRDKSMVNTVCKLMQSIKQKKIFFTAVGAAHLPGMSKYFIEAGYKVQSIPLSERLYPLQDMIYPKQLDNAMSQDVIQFHSHSLFDRLNIQERSTNINNILDNERTSYPSR